MATLERRVRLQGEETMEENSNDSDKQTERETSGTDVDPNTLRAVTENGQPLALDERLTNGSKSWEDIQRDKWRLYHRPSYPPCTGARTTLHSNDAPAAQEDHFTLLFRLQHGRQHPVEQRANGYSEGWDGQKVRQENVGKFCRAHTILSQAGVNGPIKDWTVKRVMSENLTGFSRYYEGVDGAAIGFATLYKYDDVAMAKESYLIDEADNLLGIDGEQLIEYVWQKYGGPVQ